MAQLHTGQIQVKLNDMNDESRLCQLGTLVVGTEVSGTLSLAGFADGNVEKIQIKHGPDDITDGVEMIDCPYVSFDAAPGFTVIMIADGTNGTQFRVQVTYDADEYIYEYGAEPGAGGAAEVPWRRRGKVITDR